MKMIQVLDLTEEAFRPYGSILTRTAAKPLAEKEELTYWGAVSRFSMGGTVSSGILIAHKREAILKSLERHTKTAEVLVALEGESAICFCRPGNLAEVIAFRIRPGDAFVMNAGTWHWVAFPRSAEQCRFLVLFANDTESRDLEVQDLPEPLRVNL